MDKVLVFGTSYAGSIPAGATMTQEQLNQLYAAIENSPECQDEEGEIDLELVSKAWWKKLEELGTHGICCDWKERGRVVEDFANLMEEYGFIVLDDPSYDTSDMYGWVIFPPKKESGGNS